MTGKTGLTELPAFTISKEKGFKEPALLFEITEMDPREQEGKEPVFIWCFQQ
jgi:hypothetical protein